MKQIKEKLAALRAEAIAEIREIIAIRGFLDGTTGDHVLPCYSPYTDTIPVHDTDGEPSGLEILTVRSVDDSPKFVIETAHDEFDSDKALVDDLVAILGFIFDMSAEDLHRCAVFYGYEGNDGED